jgi:pyridoxamine 5'-phosphate oxidase family protein
VSAFSPAELAFLTGERLLGRIATIDAAGRPHVVPVGWRYNSELDTIDVTGRDLAATQKFRNVRRNPTAAVVIDDVQPPWRPRSVMVRGRAEALGEPGRDGALIRITPDRVTSWGLETT